MNNYVADELYNKVYHLSQALEHTKRIVDILEKENENLKVLMKNLESQDSQSFAAQKQKIHVRAIDKPIQWDRMRKSMRWFRSLD